MERSSRRGRWWCRPSCPAWERGSRAAVSDDSHYGCAQESSLPAMPSVLEQEGRWERRASSAQGLSAMFGSHHFSLEM